MRKAARVAILLALTLLVLGCGSGTGARNRPDVVITQQDQFRTVHVHSGALVEVNLRTLPGFNPWSRPVSSDTAVLAPVSSSQQPASTRTATVVDYRALGVGSAHLESGAGVHCGPRQMCPDLIRAWAVTVRVG